MRSCPTNTPAPCEPTPNPEPAPDRWRRPVGAEAAPKSRSRAPAPARPKVLSSFLVDLSRPGATASESAEVTARIRRIDDASSALGDHGFRLGDAVLDVVADLLVELVREDGGSGD